MKLTSSSFVGLKSFIVPTLILVTIVLIVPFAFIPLLENVSKTNTRLKEQEERLDGLSTKIDDLGSLDEGDINEKLFLAEQALPVGKSLAPLLIGIQSLAINSNLTIEGMTLSPGKVATSSATKANVSQTSTRKTTGKQGGVKKDAIILNLELSGTIRNVEKFLNLLQGSKRLSFADEVGIQSGSERGFDISIQLSTPFRTVSIVGDDVLTEPIPKVSDSNLSTLEFVNKLTSITNSQINEVPTNVVKDPFMGE